MATTAYTSSSTNSSNDTAYVQGRVYTIDSAHPWAQAFIVSASGHFTAVGSNDEILEIAKKNGMIVYNLQQHFVMPGIHDAHTHLLLASLQKLNETSIGIDSTHETIAQKLKDGHCACAYAHVWGDWIIANFYQGENFPDARIDRKYFDQVFPDTPLIIRDTSCHNVVVNTTALQRAGYDIDSPEDPAHGYFVRRPDGTWTGELVETATTKIWDQIPTPPLAHVKRALAYAMKLCHQYGITSVQEASANTVYLHALRELELEGKLDLDISTHIVHAPTTFALEKAETLHALLDTAETFKSKHVNTNFVKFWMDGAPLPPHQTDCRLDHAGCPDESKLLIDKDTLLNAICKYDARGMTCKIHCAGEGSARRALDVIEEVRKMNGSNTGPKHELAHCNAIHQDDIPRFAKLRVTAECSPAIFHESELIAAFPDLFKWPFKQVQDTGGNISIGSDWFLPENPSLFMSLAAILDKFGEENGRSAKETAGEKLCRVITLGGAEAIDKSHETGSIEVGKKANFIAVDRDLSRGDFDGAVVLKTWFEGKMVWSSRADGGYDF